MRKLITRVSNSLVMSWLYFSYKMQNNITVESSHNKATTSNTNNPITCAYHFLTIDQYGDTLLKRGALDYEDFLSKNNLTYGMAEFVNSFSCGDLNAEMLVTQSNRSNGWTLEGNGSLYKGENVNRRAFFYKIFLKNELSRVLRGCDNEFIESKNGSIPTLESIKVDSYTVTNSSKILIPGIKRKWHKATSLDFADLTFYVHCSHISKIILNHQPKLPDKLIHSATKIKKTIDIIQPDQEHLSHFRDLIVYLRICLEEIKKLSKCTENTGRIADEITKLSAYYVFCKKLVSETDVPMPSKSRKDPRGDGLLDMEADFNLQDFISALKILKQSRIYFSLLQFSEIAPEKFMTANMSEFINEVKPLYTFKGDRFVAEVWRKVEQSKLTQPAFHVSSRLSVFNLGSIFDELTYDSIKKMLLEDTKLIWVAIFTLSVALWMKRSLFAIDRKKPDDLESEESPESSSVDVIEFGQRNLKNPKAIEACLNKLNLAMSIANQGVTSDDGQLKKASKKIRDPKKDRDKLSPESDDRDAMFAFVLLRIWDEMGQFMKVHGELIKLKKELTSSVGYRVFNFSVGVLRNKEYISVFNANLRDLSYRYFFLTKDIASSEFSSGEVDTFEKKILVKMGVLIAFQLYFNSHFSRHILRHYKMPKDEEQRLEKIKYTLEDRSKKIDQENLQLTPNSLSCVHQLFKHDGYTFKLMDLYKKIKDKLKPDEEEAIGKDFERLWEITYKAEHVESRKAKDNEKANANNHYGNERKKNNAQNQATMAASFNSISPEERLSLDDGSLKYDNKSFEEIDALFSIPGNKENDIAEMFSSFFPNITNNEPFLLMNFLLDKIKSSRPESETLKKNIIALLNNPCFVNQWCESIKNKPWQHTQLEELLETLTTLHNIIISVDCLLCVAKIKDGFYVQWLSTDYVTRNKTTTTVINHEYLSIIDSVLKRLHKLITKFHTADKKEIGKIIALKTQIIYLFLALSVSINRNLGQVFTRKELNREILYCQKTPLKFIDLVLQQRNQLAHMAFMFIEDSNFKKLVNLLGQMNTLNKNFIISGEDDWTCIMRQKDNPKLMTESLKLLLSYYAISLQSTFCVASGHSQVSTSDILKCMLYEFVVKPRRGSSVMSFPINFDALSEREKNQVNELGSDSMLSTTRYRIFHLVDIKDGYAASISTASGLL